MKSVSIIKYKQSNKNSITARRLTHLSLCLIAVVSISFAGNGLAQTFSISGGTGGIGNGSDGGGSGGVDSIIGTGGGGGSSGNSGGGGGGGGGVTGGSGGSGGASGVTVGGTGGVANGGNGGPGGNCSSCGSSGGAGGGGGGAGLYSNAATTLNNASLQGGNGGAGGYASGGSGGGGGGGAGGFGLIAYSTSVTNTSTIIGGAGGAGGNSTGANGGGGNGGDGGVGVFLTNNSSLINSGIITGGAGGAAGGTVYGSAGTSGPGVYVWGSTAGSITNTGTISGGSGSVGIQNAGTISTLNNAQGAGNASGALTYTGSLPTNYNIIIASKTNYGQLAVTSGTGSTAFGIYTGSLVLNNTKYTAVLSGITSSQVTNKSGTYGGYSWTLSLESGSSTVWDLFFGSLGPSIANTNQSIVNTASALQGTYTLQNSVLANSFSYDCTVFGANDICVSAGGRNTQVQAANGLNNNSALLIAAYRAMPNVRVGAYADQNLSASNPGGTVNLGNNTPLIGLFAAWNERLDGTGTEVKVSAAYGQKNTTMTRSAVGSGTGASEAGSGSSTLNSQGTQLTAKYGFGILDNVIVSPYVGVRYTQNTMAGYTEGTSSTVTAPLTYSALNTNATTALAGVGASYRVIPQVMTFASAGVETDTNTANGTYSATNSSIGTLTPVNFNANPVRTRPTATVGAYYDIEKNQRLGITGIYRQEAYQAVSTTTVMATYTVGL